MACWTLRAKHQAPPLKDLDQKLIWVRPDRQPFLVGRKADCAVMLSADMVSRHHFQLLVSTVEGNSELHIADLGSKLGTFVNEKRIEPQARVKLSPGDVVNVPTAISFTVEMERFLLCLSSSVDGAAREPAVAIGLSCAREWTPNCTHFVASNLMVTSRLMNALLHGRPIVRTSWITKFAAQPIVGFVKPSEEEELPALAPALTNIPFMKASYFTVQPERRTLFSGLSFIVPPDARAELKAFVQLAGGQIIALADLTDASDFSNIFFIGNTSPDPRVKAVGEDSLHTAIVSTNLFYVRSYSQSRSNGLHMTATQGGSLTQATQGGTQPLMQSNILLRRPARSIPLEMNSTAPQEATSAPPPATAPSIPRPATAPVVPPATNAPVAVPPVIAAPVTVTPFLTRTPVGSAELPEKSLTAAAPSLTAQILQQSEQLPAVASASRPWAPLSPPRSKTPEPPAVLKRPAESTEDQPPVTRRRVEMEAPARATVAVRSEIFGGNAPHVKAKLRGGPSLRDSSSPAEAKAVEEESKEEEHEEEEQEEEIKITHTVVETTGLFRPRPVPQPLDNANPDGGVNYKRFKKVQPLMY